MIKGSLPKKTEEVWLLTKMGITPSPKDIVISGGFCHFSEDFVMMINLSLCQKINFV